MKILMQKFLLSPNSIPFPIRALGKTEKWEADGENSFWMQDILSALKKMDKGELPDYPITTLIAFCYFKTEGIPGDAMIVFDGKKQKKAIKAEWVVEIPDQWVEVPCSFGTLVAAPNCDNGYREICIGVHKDGCWYQDLARIREGNGNFTEPFPLPQERGKVEILTYLDENEPNYTDCFSVTVLPEEKEE